MLSPTHPQQEGLLCAPPSRFANTTAPRSALILRSQKGVVYPPANGSNRFPYSHSSPSKRLGWAWSKCFSTGEALNQPSEVVVVGRVLV